VAKDLQSANFDQKVIKNKKTVLVDFHAPWCGPCQAMAPTIDEISEELKDKAEIFKVNVDEENDLANQYQVMSVPTILIFKDGKVIKQFNGVTEKDDLVEALKN
jgi:thioredoxin 1